MNQQTNPTPQDTPKTDDSILDDLTLSKPAIKKRPMLLLSLIALLILAIIGLIAFGLLKSYTPNSPSPTNSQTHQPPTLLQKAKNKIAPTPPITLQGYVEAETINISTKLPSRVATIYVKQGQTVKKDTPLVKLISPEIEAKKQQANAMLQSALALQSSAERGTREENVETLYANWQSAKAQAELAKQTYERGEYLYQEGVISRQRRDEMQAAHLSSSQIAQGAHQQYLKAKRGRTNEQKSTADAQVKIAKAAVAEAAALDAETLLVAPKDGMVSKIYAKPSELVMPAIPMMSLLDSHQFVSLTISEEQYAHLYQQSVLTGFIPALNQTANFSLEHIEAEGEFATIKNTRQTGGYDVRSFKIHLIPTKKITDLKVGMSVIFELPTQTP